MHQLSQASARKAVDLLRSARYQPLMSHAVKAVLITRPTGCTDTPGCERLGLAVLLLQLAPSETRARHTMCAAR